MAQLVMDPAIQTMYSQITGSIPVRTDVDLSGAGWSDGQRTTAKALKDAVANNQAVLSLAHNMAQENGMTAAMIDVITEFVKNKSITPDQATTRLAEAVVHLFLVFVRQDVVRLGRFLESIDRLGIARVAVGVIGGGGLAVGAFDLVGGSSLGDSQHFVIVALRGHGGRHGLDGIRKRATLRG